MVCISCLDISGTPAHVCYLIQHFRQQLLRCIPVLAGLWPAADSALSDAAIQTAIGLDYFTSSLGQSVMSCVEAARQVEAADVQKAAA